MRACKMAEGLPSWGEFQKLSSSILILEPFYMWFAMRRKEGDGEGKREQTVTDKQTEI